MNTVHNLKARGAAFSLPNLTQVEEGTGGTGVALCTCGWTSEPLPSGRARKAAHAEHKNDALTDDLIGDHLDAAAELAAAGVGEEDIPDAVQSVIVVASAYAPEDVKDEADFVCDGVADEVEINAAIERAANVPVVSRVYEWRGNYSIVFAPATVELAEAFRGVDVKTVNVSAVLRQSHLTGSSAVLDGFVTLLDEFQAQALKHLKEWQLTHRAERKGLTDMQKFIQHRNVLASFTAVFAAKIDS